MKKEDDGGIEEMRKRRSREEPEIRRKGRKEYPGSTDGQLAQVKKQRTGKDSRLRERSL